MSEPIISVSGLRGIVGTQLTPLVAMKYVAAFCSQLSRGKMILARDGRASGSMLADAVAATLQAHGFQVDVADVAATPTVGVLVREAKAVGGIQISASHNPPEYNGLKLFNAEGRVIPAQDGQQVLSAYRSGLSRWCTIDELGLKNELTDPHAAHLEKVLRIVDVPSIVARRFKVYLDSNHGAGSLLGARLLDALSCQVFINGREPNGEFAHPPEPIVANLKDVAAEVKQGGYHIAFCQDPDADRLAVIDELGNYIGEEYTLALCLMHILKQRKGPIVTNCATSSMSEILADRAGVPFHRAAVGEANVVDKMLEVNAVFGGEGNGGPIDPKVGWVRDSFVGMAIILNLMADSNRTISQLVSELPRRVIVKNKMSMAGDQLSKSFELLEQKLAAPLASRMDGLRLDWPNSWLLLRGSNTEPIVRLIAEAENRMDAEKLIEKAMTVLARS